MKIRRRILTPLLLLAFLGCEADGIYDKNLSSGDIQTLKNGITIHRVDEDGIYYLDGNMKDPSLVKLFAPQEGEKIVWTKPGPDPEEPTQLFVLTAPDDPRNTAMDERLYRVTVDKKAPTAYKTGSLFDQMVFDPDKRFAILYHGDANSSSGLYNPNEVALTDLTKSPSKTNPQVLNVSMDGRKIDMVSFVPGLHVGGTERQLAIFLAGSIARVVDLDDPEGTWAKVPLLPSDDTQSFVAAELIAFDETEGCDNAACETKLFIRSPSTEDIYYITLGRSPDGFEGVQTKQLEAGGYPTAMAIVKDADTTLLAVLSTSSGLSKINFVDIDTSAAFNITVEDYLTDMTLLADEEPGDKLVLWGSSSDAVYFLGITDLIQEKGRNLSTFIVQSGITLVRELDNNRLLVISNSQDLVLLDLVTEKASMLSSTGSYDWSAAQIYKDIFYVVPESADRVDYYDLESGSPDSLLLDDQCVSMHLLSGRNTGVVWHNTATGRVTLFPLSTPTRSKAVVVDGLWLAGSLNVKGEN